MSYKVTLDNWYRTAEAPQALASLALTLALAERLEALVAATERIAAALERQAGVGESPKVGVIGGFDVERHLEEYARSREKEEQDGISD